MNMFINIQQFVLRKSIKEKLLHKPSIKQNLEHSWHRDEAHKPSIKKSLKLSLKT